MVSANTTATYGRGQIVNPDGKRVFPVPDLYVLSEFN